MEPIVYIVDDDAAVLRSALRVLRAEGFHAEGFESSEAFLAGRDPDAGGCLILDVRLPGLDGLALQQRLIHSTNALPIVFVTGGGDIPTSVQAIKAGAVDFLVKPVRAAALLGAVRTAIDRCIAERREREEAVLLARRLASLTPREREILEAVAAGRLNKQIASDLGIVEQTVKFHRGHIMERMHARTVAELMYMAARLGLADIPEAGPGPDNPDDRMRGIPPRSR